MDGTVSRGRERLIVLARTEAKTLLTTMRLTKPPPPEHLMALRRVLGTFPAGIIPEMLFVGLALGRAIHGGDTSQG